MTFSLSKSVYRPWSKSLQRTRVYTTPRILTILFFLFSSFSIASAQCNLVVNGNFSQAGGCPQNSFTSPYLCRANPPLKPIGETQGCIAVTSNASLWNNDPNAWWATDRTGNTNFLISDAGLEAGSTASTTIWSQQVNVTAGVKYTFTAWARNLINPNYVQVPVPDPMFPGIENVPTITLRVNQTNIMTSSPLVYATASNQWVQVSGTYTAATTGTITLNVAQDFVMAYNDIAIDDISFTKNIPTPTIAETHYVCFGSSISLKANGGLPGMNYFWYTTPTGGTPVFIGNPFVTTPPAYNTYVYYVALNDGTCEGARTKVVVKPVKLPLAPLSKVITQCATGSATLVGEGAEPTQGYVWYKDLYSVAPLFTGNPFVTPVLTNNTTYWLAAKNKTYGCESPRVKIEVKVKTPPPVASNVTLCGCGSTILQASGSSGYYWFDAATGGNVLGQGASFQTPVLCNTTTYWVMADDGYCKSTRVPVTVTVQNGASTELVINGEFNAGTGCPQPTFASQFTCATAQPQSDQFTVGTDAAAQGLYWDGRDRNGSGNILIINGFSKATVWKQKVEVVAGITYTYAAWAKNIQRTQGVAPAELPYISLMTGATTLITSPRLPSPEVGGWVLVTTEYTPTTSGLIEISILQHNTAWWNDIALDGISFRAKSCAPNTSLQFDAIDDVVTIPFHPAYAFGTGDFTMEATVKYDNINSGMDDVIMDTYGINGFTWFTLFNQYTTTILLQVAGNTPNYYVEVPRLDDGRCHHLAVRRQASVITIYLDGVVKHTVMSTGQAISSFDKLFIGNEMDYSVFGGSIHEIRLWNTARSNGDIANNAWSSINGGTPGLVGLWRFNEQLNTQQVVDQSIHANHGYLGTSAAVEASDPVRVLTACYSGDRQGAGTDAASSAEVSELLVSPNPFQQSFQLSLKDWTSGMENYTVEILDVRGQLVYNTSIDGSGEWLFDKELASGMYLIKVTGNGVTRTVKAIKE